MFLLQKDKRRAGAVPVQQTIDELLAVFQPLLADAGIVVERHRLAPSAQVRGSVALVEAALTNLITNSIDAFNTEGARHAGRIIRIQEESSGDRVLITITDNGPGIHGLAISELWLPGRTTKPGGTGFGLTIVRDSVDDLGGQITARGHGDLGGAEFTIELPALRSSL
jgi:C4-dicarboxylate-specific signal transduction histidine kinase